MRTIVSFLLLVALNVGLLAVPCFQEQPVIDGKLGDPVWEKVPWQGSFVQLKTLKPALAQTRFKLYHNGTFLYLAVECDEPCPSDIVCKPLKEQSDMLWSNDSVELTMIPDLTLTGFYKIIVDTRGVFADCYGQDDNTNSDRYIFNTLWRSKAMVKTQIGEKTWCVEMAIPLGAMNFTSTMTSQWRLNVARNRWGEKAGKNWRNSMAELSSWSPVPYYFHVWPKAFKTVVLEGFSPADFAYDVEDFKEQLQPGKQGLTYDIQSTFYNNANQRHVFQLLGVLTNRDDGRQYRADKLVFLQKTQEGPLGARNYQTFSLTFPQVQNGTYVLTWDLLTNDRSPRLLKRMCRQVKLKYIPLQIKLIKPAYRNNLYATMPDKTIVAQLELKEAVGIPLTVKLTGEHIQQVRTVDKSTGCDRVSFDGATLPDGRYTLTVSGKTAHEELTASLPLRKLPYLKGEVWLDAHGVTHVDGKPFLPMGWNPAVHGPAFPYYNTFDYWSRYTVKTAISEIRNLYENFGLRSMVMPFQESRHGNPWVPRTVFKDPDTRYKGLTPQQRENIIEFVTGIHKEEGILGYRLADEPECRDNSPRWYEEAYALLAELDPWHPCIMLNFGREGMRKYHTGCDILLPDCYPQYFEDGTTRQGRWMSTDWAKTARSLRPSWLMPLFSCWPAVSPNGVRGIAPTHDDQRSQVFQAFIHNIKGIVMYAWFDSQRFSSAIVGAPALAKTIAQLKNYLLSDSVPEGVTVRTQPESRHFQAGLKEVQGKLCLIAVNTSLTSTKVEFLLKGRFTGNLYAESGKSFVAVKDGRFSEVFAPNETKIYLSDRHLAESLRSAADIAAEIQAHRAARKKPGNLIGRGEMLDIEYIRYGEKGNLDPGVPKITASSDKRYFLTQKYGSLYHLIDGLTETSRPEYTWSPLPKDKQPWVQFQLDKKATMRLVKLYTPQGNCKAGAVLVNGRRFAFQNREGKKVIRIPLPAVTADCVRIECTEWTQQGKGVDGRLLCEVEIY